jgi:hypothetical protein
MGKAHMRVGVRGTPWLRQGRREGLVEEQEAYVARMGKVRMGMGGTSDHGCRVAVWMASGWEVRMRVGRGGRREAGWKVEHMGKVRMRMSVKSPLGCWRERGKAEGRDWWMCRRPMCLG